jgi:hypothetical protein
MMSESGNMTVKPGRVPAAMTSPAGDPIPRQPRSIRRTSHIDMLFGEHADGGALVLAGSARDLVTMRTCTSVVGAASVRAGLGRFGQLEHLTIEPTEGAVESLLGKTVGPGFRDAVHAAFADQVAAATPLALLLDDLPVAALISGYARLYRGEIVGDQAAQAMKSDICSGWRAEGTMMTSVHSGHGVPVTIGPAAPAIVDELAGDPDGWHAIGSLPVGAMRRRRLVDVTDGGDVWQVRAMFRDTHVDPDGDETVLHEYALRASVDVATRTFTSCKAVPRVLPWVECPVAAASADQLVGRHVDGARDFVRAELRGTTTCTHLNDLLRSLGDVGHLADALRPLTDRVT